MRIDAEDLRRHYAQLSDDEILALDRTELVDMAQRIYDEEVSRRGLDHPPEEEEDEHFDEPEEVEEDGGEPDFSSDLGPPPDWLEDAACAHAIAMYPGVKVGPDTARVRGVLRAAGIPSYVIERQPLDPNQPRAPEPSECCVMVPGELTLHATSVIEREIFNPQHEADWRSHLEALSDEQLRMLKPEVFCAPFLDRAARLKRAYQDEIASRKLK